MKIMPALEEVKRIAATGKYDVLPVSCELLSDIRTPIEAMKILKNISTHCYMLESVAGHEKWGRYTFLGFDPKLEITCINGELKAGSIRLKTDDPSAFLRQILAEHRSPRFDYLPSFTGGLVGYLSYDYLGYSEPSVRTQVQDTEAVKDVDLMLFDKVIAFDNFRQKIILIVNMTLDDPETGYNKAVLELKQLRQLLISGAPKKEPGGRLLGEVTPLFDKETFCGMVEKAKSHIREGDIFQIVLSNRLSAPFEGSLLNTYRVLRTINPSPYMFYFSGTDVEVAGASPETLVRKNGGLCCRREKGQTDMTNPNGRFGIHGGQYIPETLMNAVIELEQAYNHYKNDPEFNRELTALLNEYAGRPSRLYYAEKMTKDLGGAKIYLKREDLNHTGAHKINNVLGQALLAKKMGKTRLIAETGAGQHAWPPPRRRPSWVWNAWYLWEKKTLFARL